MGTPFLNVVGRGLQYASIATAWGAEVQGVAATGLDAAIYRWGGTARTEFASPGPMPSLLLVRGLSTFATENFFDGKPDNTFRRALPTGRVALARPDAQLRAVNAPGSVLHLYLPPAALTATAESLECRISLMDRWQALEDPTLDRLMVAVGAELTSPLPASALLDETLAMALVSALARSLNHRPIRDPVRGGLTPWAVRQVVEYLHSHLAEDVTLGELALVARLSPFHFARMFRATMGQPPHRYLRRLRCERAQAMLRDSDLPVIEVALAVGYDTPQAFARMFRAETGVTPSAWRQERRS